MSAYFKDIDKGWKGILKNVPKIDGSFAKVGFQNDVTNNEGTSIAQIAAYNEFGTRRIPARPFMQQSADKNRKSVNDFKEKELNAILTGKREVKASLDRIGVLGVSNIKKSITELKYPEKSERTLAIQGRDKNNPLIYTGQMRQSVSYTVKLGA